MEGKWVLLKRRISCSFLHSHASGNRGTTAEEVRNARGSGLKPAGNNEQRRKGKEQAPSSVRTGRGPTDVKNSTILEARPATTDKIPCLRAARCNKSSCDYRHPPICRHYKFWNRCIHGNNCLYRHADGEKKPQQEVEERESSMSSCDSEVKKRSKVVYLKIQIHRSVFCGKLEKRH